MKGGDAATVQVAMQWLYMCYLDEQQQKDSELLASLLSLAEQLQIVGLTEICKLLVCNLLDAFETSQVCFNVLLRNTVFFYITYIKLLNQRFSLCV